MTTSTPAGVQRSARIQPNLCSTVHSTSPRTLARIRATLVGRFVVANLDETARFYRGKGKWDVNELPANREGEYPWKHFQ